MWKTGNDHTLEYLKSGLLWFVTGIYSPFGTYVDLLKRHHTLYRNDRFYDVLIEQGECHPCQ